MDWYDELYADHLETATGMQLLESKDCSDNRGGTHLKAAFLSRQIFFFKKMHSVL